MRDVRRVQGQAPGQVWGGRDGLPYADQFEPINAVVEISDPEHVAGQHRH